ncbi:hypothetical protein OS493_001560 [Desmophyllum pertusum]|uniref:Uncharacterized protein n=1 Tax=Desmophyllum pertusum TaxID=174260 RepID=A0A9W9ZI76_9CNID|nr:hypothetical protein OS493_001560 [Desmophyllum pertusum]
MTVHDLKKLQSFHTSSLRKILRIFWPRKISNNEALQTDRAGGHGDYPNEKKMALDWSCAPSKRILDSMSAIIACIFLGIFSGYANSKALSGKKLARLPEGSLYFKKCFGCHLEGNLG